MISEEPTRVRIHPAFWSLPMDADELVAHAAGVFQNDDVNLWAPTMVNECSPEGCR